MVLRVRGQSNDSANPCNYYSDPEYPVNAYMGRILDARGELEHLDIALALLNRAGLAGSGFMLLGGTAGIAMAILACFAAVVELVLLLSLLPRIATGTALNGMVAAVYTIGYSTGFLTPLAGGALAETTGIAAFALVPAAGLAVLALALVTGSRFDAGNCPTGEVVGACR